MAVERIIPGTAEFADQAPLHLLRYALVAQAGGGGDVLDAACGSGFGSDLLAKTARSVKGVDIDPDTIAMAAKWYAQPHVEFAVASVGALPFPSGSFDTVVSFETIEHIDDPIAAVREFARVLRPQGRLFLSVPNGERDRASANPYHVQFFTLPELTALVGAHLTVTAVKGLTDELRRPALVDAECPGWIKRAIPAAVRDRINAYRYARGRVVPGQDLTLAPCWLVEAIRA